MEVRLVDLFGVKLVDGFENFIIFAAVIGIMLVIKSIKYR